MNQNWVKIKEEISKDIAPKYFYPFIDCLLFVSSDEEKYVLKAPSETIKEHVTTKYIQFIEDAIYNIHGERLKLELQIESSASNLKESIQENFQITDFNFNPNYTFSTFIVDESNRLAYTAAREIITRPAEINPLYFFGNVGVGKTHLLHAIGSEIIKRDPWKTVKYIDILSFMNEFRFVVRNRETLESFKIKYQSYNVLLVDDIQYLNSGAEKTQEEFFTLFNFLFERKRQIVIASDRPSNELPLHDRLKSRFVTGIHVDIKSPEDSMRSKILKKNSEILDLKLTDESLNYIVANIKDDIRSLIGTLNDIYIYKKTYSLLFISFEKVQEILASRIHRKKTIEFSHERVISVVSEFYSQDKLNILSKSRRKEYILPRHVCMYLLHEEYKVNKTVIGRIFNTSHSTVIHANNNLKKEIESDINLRNAIIHLKTTIGFQ